MTIMSIRDFVYENTQMVGLGHHTNFPTNYTRWLRACNLMRQRSYLVYTFSCSLVESVSDTYVVPTRIYVYCAHKRLTKCSIHLKTFGIVLIVNYTHVATKPNKF